MCEATHGILWTSQCPIAHSLWHSAVLKLWKRIAFIKPNAMRCSHTLALALSLICLSVEMKSKNINTEIRTAVKLTQNTYGKFYWILGVQMFQCKRWCNHCGGGHDDEIGINNIPNRHIKYSLDGSFSALQQWRREKKKFLSPVCSFLLWRQNTLLHILCCISDARDMIKEMFYAVSDREIWMHNF